MGNDDLNSWQASEALSGCIESLRSTYSSSQTVQQMSSYLLSLFKTVSSSLQVPHTKFFHNLAQAENISFEGDAALDDKQYGFAEAKYNNVIGTRLLIMALATDRANQIADEVQSLNTILLQPPDDDRILAEIWSEFVQSNQELFNLP